MENVAKFEINLQNLELNIAERITEEVSTKTLNSIQTMALREIGEKCETSIFKNLDEIINRKAEEIINIKIENLLNSKTEDDKSLKEILFKIMAEKVLKTVEIYTLDIQEKLKSSIENSQIKIESPNLNQGDILLKEVHDITNEGIQHVEILFNNKSVISIGNGEPEDMTLNRDLNDIFSISNLIKQAYSCGKNGKDLYYQQIEELEIK